MSEFGSGAERRLERELAYYRRECNDLGARLLRLQEEQSRAFREARRSRTVVRLVREAYRLGDAAATARDASGPMLEIVVDNAMCDRAMLLREEPPGEGKFLIAHSIGLTEEAARRAVALSDPPDFFYSSTLGSTDWPDEPLRELIGVPYLLWAYDRTSGHALLLGNRTETNISRPFEAGDQELIEAALSVYLDVLYRKQAETQLRLAKRSAEAAAAVNATLLDMLGRELRAPLEEIVRLAEVRATLPEADAIAGRARHLLLRIGEALDAVASNERAPLLDVEWVGVEEMLRSAVRGPYALSVRKGVELSLRPPRRHTLICVDRARTQQVMQDLVLLAIKLTPRAGVIGVSASRRDDGALEVTFDSPLAWVEPNGASAAAGSIGNEAWLEDASRPTLALARQLAEAHGGTLLVQGSLRPGLSVRLLVPAQSVRDDDLVL